MPEMGVDIDALHQLGVNYINNAENMKPFLQSLTNATQRMDQTGWQGQSRQYFDSLMQEYQADYVKLIASWETIGKAIQSSAQEFEQADTLYHK